MAGAMSRLAGIFGFNADDTDPDDEDEYEDYDSPVDRSDVYGDEDEDNYRSNVTGIHSYSTYSPDRGARAKVTSRTTYRSSSVRNNKVVNLNASVQMQVYVSSPESIESAREIAEQIKQKRPVIVNLERVEVKVAQRITDFLCGCCCAMNGNVQRIADKIFMIAPDNIDFAGDMALQETLNQGDLGFLYGEKE